MVRITWSPPVTVRAPAEYEHPLHWLDQRVESKDSKLSEAQYGDEVEVKNLPLP